MDVNLTVGKGKDRHAEEERKYRVRRAAFRRIEFADTSTSNYKLFSIVSIIGYLGIIVSLDEEIEN